AAGLHRQPAAFGLDPAVRNPAGGAWRAHHRRREPRADRGHPRPGALGARLRLQSPAGQGRHAGSGRGPAPPLPRGRPRPRRPHARRRSGAAAGEDAQERPAHSLPESGLPGCTLHLPAPRPAPGAGQHDRGLGFGEFRHVSAIAGLAGPGLVLPAHPGLAGKPLADIVAGQWESATRVLLDDLATLPREDWTSVDYDRFVAAPQDTARGLAQWAGWGWDRELGPSLPLSRY